MAHHRYTSSNYDLVLDKESTINTMTLEFNNLVKLNHKSQMRINEWYEVIPTAVYYKGHDDLIFKDFYIMVYEDVSTKLLNSVFISKLGEVHYNSILIDKGSKYYPAIENLTAEFKRSNIRRILAVTCLRSFSFLSSSVKSRLNHKMVELDLWDETTAGKLANKMSLVASKKPSDMGLQLMDLGFLQTHYINSAIVDIVYSNKTQQDIDDNNKLVFSIGEQLDQLFDPLSEYSPEPTEKVYQPPNAMENNDEELAQSICQELLQFQKNFTTDLVNFLQSYILPLRIRVLNGGLKGYTTSKLNQVFPPTIDEVTRINCIYLDALKLALPYGSYEVIKASGMTIPYFYKAYMRHEAATKNFNAALKGFLRDLHKQGVEEDLIYTKQKIESIMYGSLNLTKIKLILNRLAKSDSNWSDSQKIDVVKSIESSTVTIDSFAKEVLTPYHHRVFTPTGKILTELANGWPTELQYGWLTRRVVAIYDVENVASGSIGYNEVLVIFSDHILFLKINEKREYNSFHTPSISDVLMHSLINEVPISNIPSLSVNGWADIQAVQACTYADDEIVKIAINQSKGITTPYSKKPEFTRFYKLLGAKKGNQLTELINKAKILNKTQPFHLFKTKKYGLTLFSTAHDFANYSDETVRSPFAIFLKTAVDYEYLRANKIFFALSIFIETDELKLEGNYLQAKYNFTEKVRPENLAGFLCGLMSTVYERYLNYEVNTSDWDKIMNINVETLEKLDDLISGRASSYAPPPLLPEKRRTSNRRSFDIFSNSRNTSDSSVIHRRRTIDSHKSTSSKKSVHSRKSFMEILGRRSSNEENKKAAAIVQKIGKVFRSKENLHEQNGETSTYSSAKYSVTKTDAHDMTLNTYFNQNGEHDVSNISSIYINKQFEYPEALQAHLAPDMRARQETKPIKAVRVIEKASVPVPEKPLTYSQLHTSHSVRRKLSKLMEDMNYKYYDDGEVNWEVVGQDSSHNLSSDGQLNTRLMTASKTNAADPACYLAESPTKLHTYRALAVTTEGSPVTEKYVTPKLASSPFTDRVSIVVEEEFKTPREFPEAQFEGKEEDDSFSITFDDVEDSFSLDAINIDNFSSMNLMASNESEAVHNDDGAKDRALDHFDPSHDEPAASLNDASIHELEEAVRMKEHTTIAEEQHGEVGADAPTSTKVAQLERSEPQIQQFKYKNVEEYDESHNLSVIHQIYLDEMTASDFTMSSESQPGDEEMKANLSWISPSQLDVASTFKESTFTAKRKQFTSKINILQAPAEAISDSNKKYYLPKDDSVNFGEPVLRASSYSYLMKIFDSELDLSAIAEEPADTTMMYDTKLSDNLKDSSVRYLAGYITDDAKAEGRAFL